MALDPFAPVVRSSTPTWVWVVAGFFVFLLVGTAATAVLLIKRNKQVIAAAQPTPVPVTETTPTTPVAKAPEPAALVAANGSTKVEEKADPSTKPEKKSRHHSSHSKKSDKSDKTDAKSSTPAAPPPKPKKAMDQKEIDKLLGI